MIGRCFRVNYYILQAKYPERNIWVDKLGSKDKDKLEAHKASFEAVIPNVEYRIISI